MHTNVIDTNKYCSIKCMCKYPKGKFYKSTYEHISQIYHMCLYMYVCVRLNMGTYKNRYVLQCLLMYLHLFIINIYLMYLSYSLIHSFTY